MKETIKKFYSELQFPGQYTWEDLNFYDEQGIHNIYLKEIDAVMQQNINVLDVGCGTGLVSNLFAKKNPNNKFVSLDFSDSIEYGKKFAQTNGIKNITWIKKDFLEFETKEKFDLIICCGVLHHIPQYSQALQKIKDLLAPGGKLILAVYNTNGKLLKRLIDINYHSPILYEDQENNPFELSFRHRCVLKMCQDLEFNSVSPSWANKFVDFLALFNSQNGGLALYVFTKSINK
jgi:ubiquinone/menaquinone biosynthesis C-methylase UbiE